MESIKTYTGDDGTRSYLSPQEFIDESHITASVDGVDITRTDTLTDNTFVVEDQSGSYYATFGASVVLQGLEIIVKRTTPKSPLVEFDNGNTYNASDLNTATNQAIYIATEAAEQ